MTYLFTNDDTQPVFTCPHCIEVQSHRWEYILGPLTLQPHINPNDEKKMLGHTFKDKLKGVIKSKCNSCGSNTFWLKSLERDELQIYPGNYNNYPAPHKDMPEDIQKTYNESGSVMHLSLGSSAALARLTLENLLIHLGYKSGSLNDKIKDFVANGFNGPKLQKMLDVVRVYGNSGAHSGIINLDEKPEVPSFLLNLINIIVEQAISIPNNVESAYNSLPDSIKDAIDKRDS
ncbi:hypothetical protein GCM10026983_21610 [Gracilibacillus alcaliphilus]